MEITKKNTREFSQADLDTDRECVEENIEGECDNQGNKEGPPRVKESLHEDKNRRRKGLKRDTFS